MTEEPKITPRLELALRHAKQHAANQNLSYVGTHHLLLALIELGDPLLKTVVDQLEEVRSEAERWVYPYGRPERVKYDAATIEKVAEEVSRGKETLPEFMAKRWSMTLLRSQLETHRTQLDEPASLPSPLKEAVTLAAYEWDPDKGPFEKFVESLVNTDVSVADTVEAFANVMQANDISKQIKALQAEVEVWKQRFIPFAIVHAGAYGKDLFKKDGCLYYKHYDMLKAAGARMDDFTRCGDGDI